MQSKKICGALAAAALALAASATQAQTVTLKFATIDPPQGQNVTQVIVPLAKEVSNASAA